MLADERLKRGLSPEGKPLAFLSEASKVLGSSLDYETTLKNVARLMVPEFADWCAVDMLDEEGNLQRLAVEHVDPEMVLQAMQVQAKYPAQRNPESGAMKAISDGEPQLYSVITEDDLRKASRNEEHFQALMKVQICSAMVVPLKAQNEVFGILTYIHSAKGRYNQESLALATELGDRAAVAVYNAKLFGALEEIRRELEVRVDARTAELKELNTDLEAFTSSVSHDLRAPLRSIRSFARILEEDLGDKVTDDIKDSLDRIQASAIKMSQLIEDLLGFARVGRAQLNTAEVDLGELAEGVVEDLRRENRCQAATEFKIQQGMLDIGDPRLLRIVFENLLDNACKFSAKNPNPVVEVGSLEGPVYFVKDNGVGFNPEYSAKLFQAFERLHSTQEYSGTGIGLTTVERVIQKHHGKIWAESQPGEGATFYFTLGMKGRT